MFEPQTIDVSVFQGRISTSYLERLAEGYSFSELIEFKDNFLCGNWDGRFGLFVFSDHTEKDSLDSFFKINLKVENDEFLSTLNFPYEFRESFIQSIIDENRYFSNHDSLINKKQGNFLTLTTDNTIPESIDLTQWTEHQCSTMELTPQQFAKVMSHIYALPEIERDKIIAFREKEIKKRVKNRMESYILTYPCQERPYSIKLYGNDDCSYIKLFETKEAAWDCYQELKKFSMIEDSYDLIERLGFVHDN